MRDLKKHERSAIDAVARQFSTTWDQGRVASEACLIVDGNRVAVQITTLKRRRARQGHAAMPRLRFDKVATRLIARLQAAFDGTAPDTMTVLLTIAAPIRLPSKTAAALEDKIQTLLGQGLRGRDFTGTIHRNRVRIRLLNTESQQAPQLIGFVHNSDSDPVRLVDATRELLELISNEVARRSSRLAGDRWLVVLSDGGISRLAAYRYIYSQLRIATDFKKILMVFADGRVGMLTG